MKTKLGNGGVLGGHGVASLSAVVTVILVIALAGAAGWYFLAAEKTTQQDNESTTQQDNESNIGIELGQTAPDFTLTNIDGAIFSLSESRGNIIVIDLMATWCGPCIVEMDHLKQLYTDYSAQGVVIMSIDVDPSETNETIQQFKSAYGGDWVFASGPSVGTTYGVVYIPTLYIIDQQGRIAYKNVGVTTYSTLAAEVEKLL